MACQPWHRATLVTGLACLALVAAAPVAGAHRDRPGPAKRASGRAVPAPASAPPPAAPSPATAPAPLEAPPQAPPAPPPVEEALSVNDVLTPEQAMGMSFLQIALPGMRALGGFALGLAWDARAFVLGPPQPAAALKGYMCQPNMAVPGQLRFNCVGLPGEDRGGLLASIPVNWRDRPPVPSDFRVLQHELVDDRGASIEQVRLDLQVVAPAQ